MDGEDIARCPSCSLLVRVIYDMVRSFLIPTHLDNARTWPHTLTHTHAHTHTLTQTRILSLSLLG